MKNKKIILCSVFILARISLLFSQEVLTDLTVNSALEKKYREILNTALKKYPVVLDTVSLPFIDDFSKDNIYPDPNYWLDSNVYINRDYPFSPPTLGVATFDGVSKTGCPYDTTLTNGSASLPADTLTSKPINLALLPADSVYLTFFWQAKGRGNDPEATDTLLVDFFNPTLQQWNNIWFKKGYNPTASDSSFQLVSIPIKDTAYLKNAFQFRFRNYATVSGNVDHWHIDYVWLDKNRNMGDTILDDVAFAHNSRSLLKNYYAMPWEQYQASEMKTNLSFLIRNNDTASLGKNTSFVDTVFNSSGGIETSYSGGSANILPYPPYSNYAPFSNPALGGYSFPSMSDTASFGLECVLNTAPDLDRWNDTLRFKQGFYNYYAYDDGTAESGYGLNVAGGQIAYKFSLNFADTLSAVQMLFNWIPPKSSYYNFRIRVWNDIAGVPGTLLFEDSLETPHYQYQHQSNWGNLTNMFYTYELSSKQLLPAGTFYVGWVQYTTSLLNIGLDKNTNSNSKMYYNTGSGWNNSVLPGTWMIRPVFRDADMFAGTHEINAGENEIYVFPNPSQGVFTIQNLTAKVESLEVYTLMGAKVYSESSLSSQSSMIDLSAQPSGIYILRIRDEEGKLQVKKLVISK